MLASIFLLCWENAFNIVRKETLFLLMLIGLKNNEKQNDTDIQPSDRAVAYLRKIAPMASTEIAF